MQQEIYEKMHYFVTHTPSFPKPPTKTPKPAKVLEHYMPTNQLQVDLLPHMVFFDNLATIYYQSGAEALQEYCNLKLKHPQSFHEIPPVQIAIARTKTHTPPNIPLQTRLKYFINAFSISYDLTPNLIPLARIFMLVTFNTLLDPKSLTQFLQEQHLNQKLKNDLILYLLLSPSINLLDYAQDKIKKIELENRERKIYDSQGEKYVMLNKSKVKLIEFLKVL